MKYILFTALLGCLIASGLAGNSFEFYDSEGRCLHCANGRCVPCPVPVQVRPWNPFARPDFDRACPAPDCTVVDNRPVLFPIADDPLGYNQCVPQADGSWLPVRVPCQCGTFFDYQRGFCETPDRWEPHCTITGPIPDPLPCDQTTVSPTTEPTYEPTTVLPTTEPPTTVGPCQPCQPCMPCFIWWMCSPCNNQCMNPCMG